MVRQTREWDPWRELQAFGREVDQLLARRGNPVAERVAPLPVNLFADEHRAVVTAEVPGLNVDSLDVTVTPNAVRIRGERQPVTIGEGDRWHRRERPSRSVERTLELPFDVDPDTAEATYEKGVLTVRVQRPEAQRPRKVTIKAG